MRNRLLAVWFVAFAVALGATGCKRDARPMEVAKEIPPASGDTNFTPPEIRRSAPSSDSVVTKTVNDTVARLPAPAPAPKPVPVAAAPAPTPAKAEPAKPAKPSTPAPTVVPSAPVADGDPGPEGDWVLQVNIHKSEADAKAQIAKLAAQGIPAYAIPVPTEGAKLAGQYWRVRVGRFKSRAQAQAYGDRKVVPAGLKFWIDKKSNELHSAGAL
jgi:cell division septation protein DedD